MTALADQIAAGAALRPVLVGGGVTVDGGALRGLGPAGEIGAGECVALSLHDPVALIRAIAALDGQVEAMLLLSHALAADTVRALAAAADCTRLVSDRDDLPDAMPIQALFAPDRREGALPTRWLMTTSGTTGIPKIVPHTLRSLSRSVYRFRPDQGPVWGLLYDPTRFAGMQVVLQALIGGGTLVAADTSAPLAAQVAELAAGGVTHLSATPTLWRRLLMVPGVTGLPLRQVTLGGEIADQATLGALRAAFPAARVTHIYASTEAGVGFSVTDERAGFPASYFEAAPGGVRMKLKDGILWLKPPVSALTAPVPGVEVDPEGYISSGDRIALEGDRALFLGRENGMINIGGVKVYPETVEAVVKDVPGVALVQVSGKRSPVTGALVLAEVQLAEGAEAAAVKAAILETCRARLEREAVPAIVRFVGGFETNAAGKLVRTKGA
jgi:acyl-CoA synthetase (AMP-forming)/AMP-acid ligase II